MCSARGLDRAREAARAKPNLPLAFRVYIRLAAAGLAFDTTRGCLCSPAPCGYRASVSLSLAFQRRRRKKGARPAVFACSVPPYAAPNSDIRPTSKSGRLSSSFVLCFPRPSASNSRCHCRTLQPVTTVVLSVVFLHAAVRGHEIFGGVVIAVGLLVTIYAKGLERRGSSNLLRAKQSRCLRGPTGAAAAAAAAACR